MAFNQCVCLSHRRTRQFTNISAAPVSATVSVSNVHSALMHTKFLFPDKRSWFNERRTDANLHAFVTIFVDILSSHEKNKYMYTTTHACTFIMNVSVIIEPFNQYSRNGNLSTLILKPTLPKPTAYSSVISSRRLLNQENARVCATWRTSTQCPCICFLISVSELDETIWTGAYHKCDQRRLRRACAFVQSCQGHDAH